MQSEADTAYVDSVFAFEPSIDEDPRNWQEMEDLKDIPTLVETKKLAEAEPLIEACCSKHPDFGFGHLWRAKVCEARGEVDKARQAYIQGIKVTTFKRGLYHNLGMLEFNHGSLKEAARWWIRNILIQVQSKPAPPFRVSNGAPFLYLGFLAESLGETDSSTKLIAAAQKGPHGSITLNDTAKQRIIEKSQPHKDAEIAQAIRLLTTRHGGDIWDPVHRPNRCQDCGGDLAHAPSHISIPCKCGASAPIPIANIDKQLGTMVNHYAGERLCPFYTFVPPTILCPLCGRYPVKGWESRVVHDNPEEAAIEFSDPSIKRARDLAAAIQKAHGNLRRVHLLPGHTYQIDFEFADGAHVTAGQSSGEIAGLLAFGYTGGGPRNFRAFLDELGIFLSIDEVASLAPGTTHEAYCARLRPVTPALRFDTPKLSDINVAAERHRTEGKQIDERLGRHLGHSQGPTNPPNKPQPRTYDAPSTPPRAGKRKWWRFWASSSQAPPSSEPPTEVTGSEAGSVVRKAIDTARRDGWNPIASIKLNCVKCNAPVSVAAGISATRLRFVHSDGHYGQCQPFDKPLTCQKCASNLFRVTVTPTHFKEWLRASLASLKPCDQDPALGFRDADTGEIFKHPKLRPSADFDDLWLAIHPYVDPFADFNPDASFDIIETRYLGKKVPCLRHHNEKSDIVVTILKDPTGNFWWTIDR